MLISIDSGSEMLTMNIYFKLSFKIIAHFICVKNVRYEILFSINIPLVLFSQQKEFPKSLRKEIQDFYLFLRKEDGVSN